MEDEYDRTLYRISPVASSLLDALASPPLCDLCLDDPDDRLRACIALLRWHNKQIGASSPQEK